MRPDTGAAASRRLSSGLAELGTELGPPLAGPAGEAAPEVMLCGEVEGSEQYEQGGAEQGSTLTLGELKALAQALADSELDTELGLGAPPRRPLY